jgi:hypothetical protein
MNHRFLALVSVPLLLVACDGTSPGDDGSVSHPDAGPQLMPSTLFGACSEDWQCPGEGAICRTAADGWPGGYCTVPCEDRTPCDYNGVYHHCATRQGETQAYCERRCLNGLDCGRTAYTCADSQAAAGGVCIAVCSSDADCGDGTHCNTYSGECVEGEVPTTGALTGEPCDSNADCRSGQCATEIDPNGVPTGWVQGYCIGNCIIPPGFNSNNFFSGDMLPQGTCPGDAVCLPGQGQANGDLGTCYDQCMSDADCRDGYGCLQDIQLASGGAASYPNGLCVPKACNPAADDCPSGYECVTVNDANGARQVCAPM